MKRLILILAILILANLAIATTNGPAYYIDKIQGTLVNNGYTGPVYDPDASDGQWFSDGVSKVIELYDEVDSDDIFGKVSSITYAGGAGSNITAFDIIATIPTYVTSEDLGSGDNSHGESLNGVVTYSGAITGGRITAEFAITDLTNVPTTWSDPYFDDPESSGSYYIEATNEDHSAWYCWTPGNPLSLDPNGGFFVPSWNIFGGVALTMSFDVTSTGMPSTDPRYDVLEESLTNESDIFANRISSLKISDWLDNMTIDGGSGPLVERGSDVSVFIPEPATLLLLGLGAVMLRRKRRL